MKIIYSYKNCGVKNYMKEDHRSYRRNSVAVSKRKPEKNSGLDGIRTLTSAIPVQRSAN